ncbi:MAG: hypothetical protein M1825_001465 [Sarcosagium campestre]|nr:MAG: hypothetical protein M1825_001465 [Sarcosagium campestre]
MAFNFNWSPLTADSNFYSRAQELLTTALNKSPKPPIIVDDILVNELNLGSVPPELEILEIGDLAEDRFRGIFKMCYSGDAFLTLKTRVQANPLNTYLHMKPSFTSPQPLAAASGLTIPLQITLSDIKLSAFIILVFSKQKGITLVFRNDPLESLKVSSTFDSIPFVRDYLQKEIEAQLRVLLMEELPAIIHRLSLRLWVPEYRARDDEEQIQHAQHSEAGVGVVDPLASPAQIAVDSQGCPVDILNLSSLSLDSTGTDAESIFCQRNLIRLAVLTDSHRTLSLFTPTLKDTVFRAWAGSSERGEGQNSSNSNTAFSPAMSRSHSHCGSFSTLTASGEQADRGTLPSRPSLVSLGSATAGLGLGAGRHSRTHAGRKKKKRIVNLRRAQTDDGDMSSVSGDSFTTSSAASDTPATSVEAAVPEPISEEKEGEVVTPPRTPSGKDRRHARNNSAELNSASTPVKHDLGVSEQTTPGQTAILDPSRTPRARPSLQPGPKLQHTSLPAAERSEKSEKSELPSSSVAPSFRLFDPSPSVSMLASSPGGILEQAWIMRMASEIMARKAAAEEEHHQRQQQQHLHHDNGHRVGGKDGRGGAAFWRAQHEDELPPPAYEH